MSLTLILTFPQGEVLTSEGLPGDRPFTLGSGRGCQAQVNHPLVAERAVDFQPDPSGRIFQIVIWGRGAPERRTISVGEIVPRGIHPFQFQLQDATPPSRDFDAEVDAELGPIHHETVTALVQANFETPAPQDVLAVEDRAGRAAQRSRLWEHPELRRHAACRVVRAAAADRLLGASGYGPAWRQPAATVPPREALLVKLTEEALKLAEGNAAADQLASLHGRFDAWWSGLRIGAQDIDYLAERFVRKAVKDMVFGDGPLEDLLASPVLTEILIVPPRAIHVERDGRLMFTGRAFPTDAALDNVIKRIVARAGRRVDPASPLVDVRLSDGSRANVALPPVAVGGAALTVRKFPTVRLTLDDLVARGSLPVGAARFLAAAVRSRLNIVVSGGTGSGKTTLVNCLSDAIPAAERVITVEDTAELRLAETAHVVGLEARTANAEGAGKITIHDLVRNALRMRPDRIVVGECRGGEALDMLKAMNTGHEGSMTTVHANTPQDALKRLELLAMEAGEAVPAASVLQQIAAAVNLIVQLSRSGSGPRLVTAVAEVTGIDAAGVVATKTLFGFDPAEQRLRPTGLISRQFHRLREVGGLSAADLFAGDEP
jgi:pilus assembly protein CpaF